MSGVLLEKLLLRKDEVAAVLGFSDSYLKRVRETPRLNFPKPIYFFDSSKNINTTPFWRKKDIDAWVDAFTKKEVLQEES